MIQYVIASNKDIQLLMQSRLEMLRVVNELPCEYEFSNELVENSREYFQKGNQTTVLAIDKGVIGCATICYIEMMPTFSHPTGKRAHLMNVYTNCEYRRQGIALHMLQMLIQEAKRNGVTEISLDATELGRPLYKKCNFVESDECMVLNLN
jgi:ribosomal protein S18 acetylase RimI-like enzyme